MEQYILVIIPESKKEERKFRGTGEKKNILTKTGTSCYHCGTIFEKELDKSIEEQKWKINIIKTKSKFITNPNTCGWYLYCTNLKLYSGPPYNFKNVDSELNVIDDEVVVVMNMKKRTLKLIINNKDKVDS